MPSPDELRAIAERAKDDEAPDDDYCNKMRRELRFARSKWPPKSKQISLAAFAVRHGDILIRQAEYVPALADAVLSQQNRIEELERENERLRYSHLPEAVEEPSDLENDFYDSATEGYSSNSRGMEHDDDGT